MKSENILVVDDNEINLDIIQRFLNKSGFKISVATNGKDCLDIINKKGNEYSLLLLDQVIPDITGMELLQIIRKKYTLLELPIIFFTGKTEDNYILSALNAGANDYISKPFEYKILLARIKACLRVANRFQEYNCKKQELEDIVLRQNQEIAEIRSEYDICGLKDRVEFIKKINSVINDPSFNPINNVIGIINIDDFKIVNICYGYSAGNALLKEFSQYILSIMGKDCFVVSLRGDEFAIYLDNCNIEQAIKKFSNLLNNLFEFRFYWDNKKIMITCSCGIVNFTMGQNKAEEIINFASSACHTAKENGRNKIYCLKDFDKSLSNKVNDMEWLERINDAFETDRFVLYFQPIVSFRSKNKKHNEILIRMKDGDEIISPFLFLPIAERYFLMQKLDTWVIQTVFTWLEAYSDLMIDTEMAINLSGQSLSDDYVLKIILDEMKNKQIPPECICFEITETAFISNINHANVFINALKDKGIRFALDDFGSGLSSYSYLKNIHSEYVKIDGSFIKDIYTSNIDYEMVKSINHVCHVSGKKTIAEFVSDENILGKISEIGIDYAQGYYFEKPLPLYNYEDYISRNN